MMIGVYVLWAKPPIDAFQHLREQFRVSHGFDRVENRMPHVGVLADEAQAQKRQCDDPHRIGGFSAAHNYIKLVEDRCVPKIARIMRINQKQAAGHHKNNQGGLPVFALEKPHWEKPNPFLVSQDVWNKL